MGLGGCVDLDGLGQGCCRLRSSMHLVLLVVRNTWLVISGEWALLSAVHTASEQNYQ